MGTFVWLYIEQQVRSQGVHRILLFSTKIRCTASYFGFSFYLKFVFSTKKIHFQLEFDALQRIIVENNKTKILKEEKIPNVVLETTQRQTRSMTHNYSEVGLQLDAHISLNKVKSLSITPSCQSIVVTFLSARGPEKRIGVLQKKHNEYIYYYKERMIQLEQRIKRMNENVGQRARDQC